MINDAKLSFNYTRNEFVTGDELNYQKLENSLTPAEKKAAATSAPSSPVQPSASSGAKDGKK